MLKLSIIKLILHRTKFEASIKAKMLESLAFLIKVKRNFKENTSVSL